jgi:arylsulfatase
VREETLARQKKLGVVPANTVLAAEAADIKDWDALTPDEKRCSNARWRCSRIRRAHRHEVGRWWRARARGELDNTTFFYIVGDNGLSAEGGMIGVYNENTTSTGSRKRWTCSSAVSRSWHRHTYTTLRGLGR